MKALIAAIAIALLVAGVTARAWGHSEIDGHSTIVVGLRGVLECNRHGTCHDDELRVVPGIDATGAAEATVCLWAGLVAAAAIAVAGLGLGRRAVPLAARVALGVPLLVSVGATVVVMDRLGGISWLDRGWAPFAALVGALAGFYPVLATADPASATRRAAS